MLWHKLMVFLSLHIPLNNIEVLKSQEQQPRGVYTGSRNYRTAERPPELQNSEGRVVAHGDSYLVSRLD